MKRIITPILSLLLVLSLAGTATALSSSVAGAYEIRADVLSAASVKATPKPTKKPAPKPTPRPTRKPTPKPTPMPTPTPAPTVSPSATGGQDNGWVNPYVSCHCYDSNPTPAITETPAATSSPTQKTNSLMIAQRGKSTPLATGDSEDRTYDDDEWEEDD